MHPSGLHHLGDMCFIRHLCLDHRLKTRAKVETLIPQFHWNHNPPGSTPSESSSDDFYAPKTPSQRSPSKDDPNSSHGFFDPNLSCFNLYDKRTIYYKDREDPSTLSRVRYHYMRHGRQLSWDWHNPETGAPDPRLGWSHHTGRNRIPDNTVSLKNFYDTVIMSQVRHPQHLLGQGNQQICW